MNEKPKNAEFIVTGSAKFRGVSVIVHAADRQEAIQKANAGEFIGEIELNCAEMVDRDFDFAEHNSDLD